MNNAHTRLAVALALAGLALARNAAADTMSLESSVLKLEVTTLPYGYRVVEKSSGEVLLSNSATTFTVMEDPPGSGTAADAGAAGDAADAAADAVPDVAVAPPAARQLRALRAMRTAGSDTTLELDLVLEGTSDPGHVKFTFTTAAVLEVALTSARPASRVKEEFEDRGEHVYGIWEYPFGGNLDNRGVDQDYLGLPRMTGSLYTSARAPFYVTSRRYGVYARSNARGHYSIAVGGKTSFWFDEGRLTYDIIHGPGYYDVLARYTALAGGGPLLPPLWAMGSIWWHDDFNRDLRAAANPQASVIDLATQLQSQKIRASALMIDRPYGTGTQGWGNMDFDPVGFPDPFAMVDGLRARGLELVVWIANRAWNNLYTEGQIRGFLFPGTVALGPAVDLRNPAAYAWMKNQLAPLVGFGARGYKIDRGEQGEHPDAVQNQNVTLFAQLAQQSLSDDDDGPEGFVFARNVSDTGRQHTAVWNGDSEANFTGLAYSIAAGLRSGMIVMPVWGSDTGGYLRSNNTPTEEVFARWFGFSAFSPMMEVLVGDGHTPWYHYSPQLVDIARKMAGLHHDLIPYTRSFLHAARTTGAPVMRPLVFEYPGEPNLTNLSHQYLYGSELLVAPVITPGATTRAVFLPPGGWLDYNDKRLAARGPQTVTVPAPLDTIPVFVREGAIVPRGDILKGNDNWTAGGWTPSLRIEIFPAHIDHARRFDYFNEGSVTTISAVTEAGKLTVAMSNPGDDGQLEIHLGGVGRIHRDGVLLAAGTDYTFDAQARLLTVPLSPAPASTLVVEDVVSLFAEAAAPPPQDGGATSDAGQADAGVPVRAEDGCGCRLGAATASHAGGAPLLAVVLLGLVTALRSRGWPGRRSRRSARSASSACP